MTGEPDHGLHPGVRLWGSVRHCDGAVVHLAGLARLARMGDGIEIAATDRRIPGEVVALDGETVTAKLMAPPDGVAAGQRAYLVAHLPPQPGDGWLGEVLDAFGCRADGSPAPAGGVPADLRRGAPAGARRRPLGPRLATGFAALDTMLPVCRGQRIGVFAGSGVGKSMLLAGLAAGLEADVAVIGLIGERGREVADFARRLAADGALDHSVVIAATSDQSALVKRRAGLLCLATAEHFRDRGRHVLCLFDSVTRFAEAHREIALAAGEPPALRAFPPSTAPAVAALCERAGPGEEGTRGDITGVFTVLVSGSDMDEPVADMVRGILDGHVVLDRAIAERGRFPAIDLRRSVSRSAPAAWSAQEAALVGRARALIARYEEAEPMILAGLYEAGRDPVLDRAVALRAELDGFIGCPSPPSGEGGSFGRLARILDGALAIGGSAPAGPPPPRAAAPGGKS